MPCSDINSVLNLCLGFCDYELERTKTDSQSANFAPLHCIEPFTLSGEGERINSFYIFGKSLEKKGSVVLMITMMIMITLVQKDFLGGNHQW